MIDGKKFIFFGWVTFLAIVTFSMLCFHGMTKVNAAPIEMKVSGEAAAGNTAAAIEDAKKKAVQRALTRIIGANDAQNSIYQRFLADYRRYAGTAKVLDTREVQGKLRVAATVPVDIDRLQQDIQEVIASQQEKNDVAEAGFFIRVSGLPTSQLQAAQDTIIKVYHDTFQNLGFTSARHEELLTEVNGSDVSVPCEAFAQNLRQIIYQDYPEVTTAIIGEINVSNQGASADGVLLGAQVHIYAVDMLQGELGTVFADVVDSYEMYVPGEDKAVDMILRKAAMNSAKILADKTVQHWQKGAR